MATQAQTDGGRTDHDHPAADLDAIVVDPDDIIETMRRNRRDEDEQRSHVLRVTPPLEGERRAEPHVDEHQTRYPSDAIKPIHLSADQILAADHRGRQSETWDQVCEIPDPTRERSLYRDETPESEQSEEAWDEWIEIAEEVWEDCIRHQLDAIDGESVKFGGQYPEQPETEVAIRVEEVED